MVHALALDHAHVLAESFGGIWIEEGKRGVLDVAGEAITQRVGSAFGPERAAQAGNDGEVRAPTTARTHRSWPTFRRSGTYVTLDGLDTVTRAVRPSDRQSRAEESSPAEKQQVIRQRLIIDEENVLPSGEIELVVGERF